VTEDGKYKSFKLPDKQIAVKISTTKRNLTPKKFKSNNFMLNARTLERSRAAQ
jgi:hypothetical protein